MPSDYTGIALIITAIFSGLASLGSLWTAYLAAVAAVKTKEVKEELARSNKESGAKLDDMAAVTDKVHILVNSNMAAQLKISSIALRRVAELTSHPDDLAAAELANTLYTEHVGKQAEVDGKDP